METIMVAITAIVVTATKIVVVPTVTTVDSTFPEVMKTGDVRVQRPPLCRQE